MRPAPAAPRALRPLALAPQPLGEGSSSSSFLRGARPPPSSASTCTLRPTVALVAAFCLVQLALLVRGHYGLFVVSDPTHHWSTAAELRPSFLAARAGAKPLTAQLHQDLATLVPSVVADAAAAAEVPVVVPPAGGVVLPPPQPQPQPQQQLLLPPPADVFRYDAVFASSLRAPPPPPFPPGESVLVALRTGHFFGEYERVVPDCDVRCEFKSQGSAGADALWYHAPSACGGAPDRAFPAQIAVVMSMESSVNYHCLDDPTYMAGFDIEMTYRLRSAIPIPYLHREHVLDFAKPLVPFEEKRDEVIYIQSNCGATSGRDAILSALPSLGVPLHARGACLNNQPPLPRSVGKRDTMRQYKICATMENSRALDYVSEKMWDGMSAGCLPIYYGAQNIQEHLPAPEAIIDYERIGATPEKLAAEILRLTSNKAAYEATMAWRTKPLAELGEGYQRLVADCYMEHSQCRLCKLVATMRRQRQAAAGGGGNATTPAGP